MPTTPTITVQPSFEYDVFISYRTKLLPDALAAEALQQVVENFPIPRALRGQLVSPSRWRSRLRVFRDLTDLNAAPDLDKAIEDKLLRSRFLIVVCTPELPKSAYCLSEVQFFREHHGRDRILFLLVQGEPHESIPPNASDDSAMPMAADVRSASTEEIVRMVHGKGIARSHQARFKLLAPILGCGTPDQLVKRDQLRFFKQLAIIVGVFALFIAAAAWAIQYNRNQAHYDPLPKVAQFMLQSPVTEDSAPVIAALGATAWRHHPTADAWNAMQRVSFVTRSGSFWHDDLDFDAVIVRSDGPRLLNLSESGKLEIQIRNDEPGEVLIEHPSEIVAFEVSPDNRHIATATDDGHILICDAEQKQPPRALPNEARARKLAFSLDGRFLAAADAAHAIRVWNLSNDSVAGKLPAGVPIATLALSRNAEYVATASEKGAVLIRRLSEGQTVATLERPNETAIQVTFSPDGQLLTVAKQDGESWMIPVEAGDCAHQLASLNADAVALSADGKYLASSHSKSQFDYEVRITSIADGATVVVSGGIGQFAGLSFSADGRTLVVSEEQTSGGGGIGVVDFWRFGGAERELTRIGLCDSGPSTVSPDRRLVAVAGDGGRVQIKHTDGSLNAKRFVVDSKLEALRFNASSTLLATITVGGRVQLWAVADGKAVADEDAHDDLLAWTFLTNDKQLITLSKDLTVRSLSADSKSSSTLFTLEDEPDDDVQLAAFSPDGGQLAVFFAGPGDEGICRVYRMPDGALVSRCNCLVPSSERHAWINGDYDGMALSPGGKFAVVRQFDDTDSFATSRLIATATGQHLRLFKKEFNGAMARFSPDGRYLAMPDDQGSVRVFNVKDWSEAVRINVAGFATALEFASADELAIAGTDPSVCFWSTNWDGLVRRLGESAGRNLSHAEWKQHLPGIPWHPTFDTWPTPKTEDDPKP